MVPPSLSKSLESHDSMSPPFLLDMLLFLLNRLCEITYEQKTMFILHHFSTSTSYLLIMIIKPRGGLGLCDRKIERVNFR